MKIKKLLSINLVLCMLSSVSIVAFAEETTGNTHSDTIEYKREIAEMFSNISILDEDKTYSWNYADENVTANGITPYWSTGNENKNIKDVHGKIIDEANAMADTPIPNKYIGLVKEISRLCDKEYGGKCETHCEAFHASGNYVATLKYLWDYINEVSELTKINTTIINDIGNKCYNSLPDNIKNNNNIQDLKKYTKKIVRNNFEIPSGVTNQTELKRALYVLYGIMYHFMGDIYAHRLLVPTKAVQPFVDGFDSNSDSFEPKKMFDPADFNQDKQGELINLVQTQKLQFNHVYKYYVEDNSTNYADSATFYPGRVNEAIVTIFCFTRHVDDGFSTWVIEPSHGFTLNEYMKNIENMGISK